MVSQLKYCCEYIKNFVPKPKRSFILVTLRVKIQFSSFHASYLECRIRKLGVNNWNIEKCRVSR